MKSKFLLPVLIVIVTANAESQSNAIDSLDYLLQQNNCRDTVKVKLLNNIAFEYYRISADSTIKYADEAMELAISLNYEKGLAWSYYQKGLGYYSKSEYKLAKESIAESQLRFEKLKYKKGIAKCYNRLGLIHKRLGEYSLALEQFQKALMLYKQKDNKDGMSTCFNNMGITYKNLGDYSMALEFYQKSLQLNEELGDKAALISCYNNIGIIYRRLGDYLQALEYHEKAQALSVKIGDDNGKAVAANSLGIIYQEMKDYEKALEKYKDVLEICKMQGNNYRISMTLNNIAIVYQKMNDYPEALLYFEKSFLIKEQLGNKQQICATLINLGNMYLLLKDYSQSKKYLERALKLNSQLGSKVLETEIYINMANWNFEQNKLQDAYRYGKKAYILADKIGDADRTMQSADVLAEISAALGNYYQAYQAHVAYKTMYDSIHNVEFLGKLKSLEHKQKYEKDKLVMTHEIEQQNLTIEKNKQQARLTMAILALVLVLGAFGIYDYIKLRKKNKLLFAKNLELTKAEQLEDVQTIENIKANKVINKEEVDTDHNLLNELTLVLLSEKLYTNNNLTLELLAERLGTNRTYLSRLINQKYACNFNKFINKYRIKEARVLIVKPEFQNYTIEGIANEVGFNSKSAFNMAFKEHTGITPSYYKAEAMNEQVFA